RDPLVTGVQTCALPICPIQGEGGGPGLGRHPGAVLRPGRQRLLAGRIQGLNGVKEKRRTLGPPFVRPMGPSEAPAESSCREDPNPAVAEAAGPDARQKAFRTLFHSASVSPRPSSPAGSRRS